MNKKFTTSQITLLGLMVAILLLMAYTPLGYLNIGPLAITFNIIPVAISAITMGPVGGAIAGAVFGLTSFGQCIGIGGTSIMGATLFGINPLFAFIQRFIPRLVDANLHKIASATCLFQTSQILPTLLPLHNLNFVIWYHYIFREFLFSGFSKPQGSHLGFRFLKHNPI